jgi:sulfonate transport system permease protein
MSTFIRTPSTARTAPARAGLSRLGALRTPAPLRLRRALGPLLVLLGWWLVSLAGLVDHRIVAGPGQVWQVFASEFASGALQQNLLVSLGRVAQGLALGVTLGVAAGCLSGTLRLGDDLVDPVVQMLRTVPFVALTSLFIVWFGIDERPKVFLVALAGFFPVYLNTYNGIRNVDARLVEAAQSFGLGRLGLLREVILPGALPQALLGLRYALGVSWLALVIAEQINAQSGVGFLLTTAQNNLDTAGVIAGIVTYAAMGILTDAVVRLLEGRLLAWRRGFTGS